MITRFMADADDLEPYFRFVEKAIETSTYPDFEQLLRVELRAFFPFQTAIAGFGYITSNKTVQAHKLIPIDFPVDYLNAIATPDGGFTSPKMAAWIESRAPQLFEDEPGCNGDVPEEWLRIVRRFGIRNIAAHGVQDFRGRCTSYFAFTNLSGRLSERHCSIMHMTVPMLHSILARIIDDVPYLGIEPKLHFDQYSPREVDVLRRIARGAKQKEMAEDLCLSEHTVRNLIYNLYKKLGVERAIEAVERARALGILD